MTHDLEQQRQFKKFFTMAFKVLFAIVAAIVFVLLFGYGIMWLWNWLMPDIFGLSTINYWQAVGILVLSKVLFGSFGNHHSRKSKRKSYNSCREKRQQNLKMDFSKWQYYDEFWKEEGESAYKNYVERMREQE